MPLQRGEAAALRARSTLQFLLLSHYRQGLWRNLPASSWAKLMQKLPATRERCKTKYRAGEAAQTAGRQRHTRTTALSCTLGQLTARFGPMALRGKKLLSVI